jgi:hypothetical protein
MRIRRLGWGLTACVLLSAAYGVADAQSTTPKPATADTSVGMERQVALSPKEQLTQADMFMSRMNVTATNVRHLLEQARAARDVVKTLCLNDKLNQVDVANRSARDRRQSLDQAVQRSDADLANHEFTILTVLRQRVEQLSAEANQCIGEEAVLYGETKIVTTIDPNLPNEDPSTYPDNPIISMPPPCASCIK